MPFFLRQLPDTTALFVLIDVGAVPVPVGLLEMIEGPVPVPVGNGLKPVPEPWVGPPVGPPYVVVG